MIALQTIALSRRSCLAPIGVADGIYPAVLNIGCKASVDPRLCICNIICVYDIHLAEGVEEDLERIPVFYRNHILDAIEKQLAYTPASPTRNRKLLANLIPPWDAVPPIWELRVGDYRVFYDVSEELSKVYVRVVRRKPRGKKTEDIL